MFLLRVPKVNLKQTWLNRWLLLKPKDFLIQMLFSKRPLKKMLQLTMMLPKTLLSQILLTALPHRIILQAPPHQEAMLLAILLQEMVLLLQEEKLLPPQPAKMMALEVPVKSVLI
jgi:hypothetical protein